MHIFVYYLLSAAAFLLGLVCVGTGGSTSNSDIVDDDNNIALDIEEGGQQPSTNEPADDLGVGYDSFDPYADLNDFEDEDWQELLELQFIMSLQKQERSIKYAHKRVNWEDFADMLIQTDNFDNRYRMNIDEFNHLLGGLRDALTVSYSKSRASTTNANNKEGNGPIYPEIIMSCGLRYVGLGDSPATLADLHGISEPSSKRAINMFLDAVDCNEDLPELQITLPNPTDTAALNDLSHRWNSVSTAYNLFPHHLGALDGWLPRTEKPRDVTNKSDYFSGHYQCYGLNVQAMCDPDLVFLYLGVAAPGKTNDIRAFGWCNGLHKWLDALPDEYHISADNAYPLSRRILIPFSAAAASDRWNRVYNFYLSQLRIRIEMSFGLLTTKWRRLRMTLNCTTEKNARIVRVCAKLHNYCIRMKQKRGDGRIQRFDGERPEPSAFGIVPQEGVGLGECGRFGFRESGMDEDTDEEDESYTSYPSLAPDSSRRDGFVSSVRHRGLVLPANYR